ncbi:MAG: phospho-N-acetylmuramoyl-pentapeptide-transferase, partial [Desulfofustis sp.]|nr:phospho-N-acetylmuramoyl-pentapeptide-transferase [Desulfofustis sp.]
MFYHLLYPLHTTFIGFNVFRYITFRSILAAITAFLIVILFGNWFIRTMKRRQIGQVIRDDGPETHMAKKG